MVVLLLGCDVEVREPASPSTDGGAPPAGAGIGGGPANAGGGTANGGAVAGGAGGLGGTSAGTAGAAGNAGGTGGNPAGGNGGSSGSGGAAGSPTTFACSQVMGPNVAGEWFAAGFEAAVGNGKWQVKAPHHAFIEDWANPEHDVWLDSNCQGTYSECETKSHCDAGAPPDRLLFVTQQGDYLTTPQATWESLINAAITTFKAKYPKLTRVELLTFVRGPAGEDCGGETTVSPQLDAAHKAIADASNGFVGVGPHLTASDCMLFSGPPHMKPEGNMEIAEQLSQHYKAP